MTAFDSACVYATNSAYVVAYDNTTWHATTLPMSAPAAGLMGTPVRSRDGLLD